MPQKNFALKILAIIILVYFALELVNATYYLNQYYEIRKIPHNGTYRLGNGPEIRILLIGDSIASGIGASSFNSSLAGLIAKKYSSDYKVVIVNKGRNGIQMKDIGVPDEKFNLTIVTVGTNDVFGFASINEFRSSSKNVFGKLAKSSDKVIVTGPADISLLDPLPILLRGAYKLTVKQYAGEINDAISQYPNIVYVNPLMYNLTVSPDDFASDHFHPNDNGYRIWFEALEPVLP